ncbi:unnamed protein product [Symbiodinium pilosum]|uniref:Uncharacterized protein n=1 Tax=Symbiodinium pilosum TaxID=2952 RepID=A0A812SB31_SYMPI|nr:unnamed protein product [Symbiodinium pilosum]
MVQPKRKRTDLSTPAWLRDRWNKGAAEKDEMADVLQRVNRDKNLFVNELYKIVVKKVVVEIVKDQGWYAETQMKTELKWSA